MLGGLHDFYKEHPYKELGLKIPPKLRKLMELQPYFPKKLFNSWKRKQIYIYLLQKLVLKEFGQGTV